MVPVCQSPTCTSPVYKAGLCLPHLTAAIRSLKDTKKAAGLCIEAGCEKPRRAQERCSSHYQAWRRANGTTPCKVSQCTSAATGKGMCDKHQRRTERHGSPHISQQSTPHQATCTHTGCENAAKAARGLCWKHYRETRTAETTPSVAAA